MRLVLYEPDIPQNAGAMMRLAACLEVPLELIEPCGFSSPTVTCAVPAWIISPISSSPATASHAAFEGWRRAALPEARLLLLTTKGELSYLDFAFRPDDLLMVGRESAGVPEDVRASAAARLRIPLAPGRRSLNVALAAAMVLGEALRQTGLFPGRSG